MDLKALSVKHAELASVRYDVLDKIASGLPLMFIDVYNDLGCIATFATHDRAKWPIIFMMARVLHPATIVVTMDSYMEKKPEVDKYVRGSLHQRFMAGDKSIKEALNIFSGTPDSGVFAITIPYERASKGERILSPSEIQEGFIGTGDIPDYLDGALQSAVLPEAVVDILFNSQMSLTSVIARIKSPGRWCNVQFDNASWKVAGQNDMIAYSIEPDMINPAVLNGKKFRQLFEVNF